MNVRSNARSAITAAVMPSAIQIQPATSSGTSANGSTANIVHGMWSYTSASGVFVPRETATSLYRAGSHGLMPRRYVLGPDHTPEKSLKWTISRRRASGPPTTTKISPKINPVQ